MIVLVSGMHRSGTSLLASVIESLGVKPLFENDMAADINNPATYFESTKIAAVNDEILSQYSDRWDSALTGLRRGDFNSVLDIPRQALLVKSALDLAGKSLQDLAGKFAYVKDPRLCLTYPEWDVALSQVSPMVLSVRHPITVSQSLWLRDGLTRLHSFALWWIYYQSVLRSAEPNRQLLFVGFENLCDSTIDEITRISDWLTTNFDGLSLRSDLEQAQLRLNPLFVRARKPERTSNWVPQSPIEKEILDIYQALLNDQSQSLRSEIFGSVPSWVTDTLSTYSSVRHRLTRTHKDLSVLDAENLKLRDRINHIESESTLLAERLNVATQRTQDLEIWLRDTESERASAVSENSELRERINHIESESTILAERLNVETQRTQDLEIWLRDTESARVTLTSEAEALRSKCSTLQSHLENSKQAFHDLAEHQTTLLTSVRALDAITKSNSWRFTAPLRKIGAGVRRIPELFVDLWRSRTVSREALRLISELPLRPIGEARVAVVIHVFYTELLAELLKSLEKIPEDFSLVLTGPRESRVLTTLAKDKNSYNGATDLQRVYVYQVENRGRDIAPFCLAVKELGLDSIPFVLKLHTKKSPHRTDGDAWRRQLVENLSSSKQKISRIIAALDASSGPAMVVPDSQVGSHSEIGSNFNRVKELLTRIGITYSHTDLEDLKFGMGSMFWCQGRILQPTRQLSLSIDDFEEEAGQLDGTLAHALERVFGVVATRSGGGISTSGETKQVYPRLPKATFYSFFLPQFHTDPRNNGWWGDGFNEWQLLDRIEPLFPGHRILTPANGNRYDLSSQQELYELLVRAKLTGLSGLLMYHYVFGSQKLLRKPYELILELPETPLPIALTWANENWTRRWDGQDSEILAKQEYSEEVIDEISNDFTALIRSGHVLKSPLPTLVIYRPLEEMLTTSLLERLRSNIRCAANTEISLGGVCSSIDCIDWPQIKSKGFDFAIEFPPHSCARPTSLSTGTYPHKYDFGKLVTDSLNSVRTDENIWRGAMPGWDNSPRRGNSSHLFIGSNPYDFRRWILGLASEASSPIVINAFNEWGEGAVLEPTDQFGDSYQSVIREFSQLPQMESGLQ